MTTCPFCNSEIDDGLSRFGGNCPHCFNVIPGEEAPTDPGVAPPVASSVVGESSSGGKMMLIFGFLAFVAIGAGIGLGEKDSGAAVKPVSENALEEQAKAAEDARLAALEAEDAAAEAEALAEAAEEKVKQEKEQARARARAAASKAEKRDGPAVADASSAPEAEVGPAVETQDVVVAISTAPRQEEVSGVLETPADINRAVRKSLRRYKGQLEQCYNIALNEDEALKGRWQVSFTVEPTGKTSAVSVKPITRSHPKLETCMAKNVNRWSFPRIVEAYPYVKEYAFGR